MFVKQNKNYMYIDKLKIKLIECLSVRFKTANNENGKYFIYSNYFP